LAYRQLCEITIVRAMLRLIRQRSWFAWLALAALAGQIVLTLGHAHAGRGNDLSDALAGLCVPHVQIADHAAPAATLAGHHRETPANPGHLGGWCAYCWTMAQASATILPAPAGVRDARLYATLSLPHGNGAPATGDRAAPFDQRGPPPPSRA
jgi:hypothetical protein